MEKNKVINFQNHPKKELHLTGYLSLPLRVGDRAWIISNSGIHFWCRHMLDVMK